MKRKLLAVIVMIAALLLCACKTTPVKYTVTVLPVEHGSVTVLHEMTEVTELEAGKEVMVVTRPEAKYELVSLTVNDAPIEGNRFVMPKENVVIRAEFARITYAVTVGQIEGGTVTVDKPLAAEGETVTVTATADATHVLVEGSLTVDGEAITGNTFTMPAHAVTVGATFLSAMPSEESTMTVVLGTSEARIFARYDTAGIFLTVKVLDDEVVTSGVDFGYDDNVEILIGRKTALASWEAGYTHRFLMGACGKVLVQRANSANTFGAVNDLALNIAPGSNLYHSAKKTMFTNGKSGYVIEIYIGYDLLNLTPGEAVGNLSIAASMRDTRAEGATSWSCENTLATEWKNASTFAHILADGSIVAANA